jgi:hypothetical protein
MSGRCDFMIPRGEARGQLCNCPSVDMERFCPFHASITEQENNGLEAPKWVYKIHPRTMSHLHYENVPKSFYED